jgi:hypothetical protein
MAEKYTYDQAMEFLLEKEQVEITHVINAATHAHAAYRTRLAIQWYRDNVKRYQREGDDDVLVDHSKWTGMLSAATVPRFITEISEAIYTGDSPFRRAKRSTKMGIVDDIINAVYGTRFYVQCRQARESMVAYSKADHVFIAGFIAGLVDTSEQRRALRNGEIVFPAAVSRDGRRLAATILIGSML